MTSNWTDSLSNFARKNEQILLHHSVQICFWFFKEITKNTIPLRVKGFRTPPFSAVQAKWITLNGTRATEILSGNRPFTGVEEKVNLQLSCSNGSKISWVSAVYCYQNGEKGRQYSWSEVHPTARKWPKTLKEKNQWHHMMEEQQFDPARLGRDELERRWKQSDQQVQLMWEIMQRCGDKLSEKCLFSLLNESKLQYMNTCFLAYSP